MRFYTTERIGPNRALTPEGYLLCSEVPLARTGEMIYGPADGLPIEPKRGDERIIIHRRPEDVFAATALASMQGKPFVDDHPSDDVTPATWAKLSKGIILNPRRGTGDQGDLVIGDILITDPEIIEVVRNDEKLEISLGYDADYEQLAPGEGLQKNLIINHAALVDSGRCGPRCKIGDQSTEKGRKAMSKFNAFLMKAFKAKDAAEVEKIAEEMGAGEEAAGEHHVHVHLPGAASASGAGTKPTANEDDEATAGTSGGERTIEQRVAGLESKLDMILKKLSAGGGGEDKKEKDKKEKDKKEDEKKDDEEKEEVENKDKKMKDDEDPTTTSFNPDPQAGYEMEAPPGTSDKARKAKDSAYLADAYQQLVSQAEIIAPGARVPTFDIKSRPAVTYSMLCGSRKELLTKAYQDARLARTIDACNGGRAPTFDRMTCDAMRVMLSAVTAEAARLNNRTSDSLGSFGAFVAKKGSGPGNGVKGPILTPADLNALARKMYSNAG